MPRFITSLMVFFALLMGPLTQAQDKRSKKPHRISRQQPVHR